jgi:hypothetical protein
MVTFFGSLLIALTFVQALSAQTESFDIATFIPPAGWSHTESNGVLTLQSNKKVLGKIQFCQIYLFPSSPSNASPAATFQSEWDSKVARPLGLSSKPQPEMQTTPDGWKVVTAHADMLFQGVPMRAILVSANGFGKLVSVVVTVSPDSYQAELETFFQHLNFTPASQESSPSSGALTKTAPPAAAESSGPASNSKTSGSLNDYIYSAPANWGTQKSRDRITLLSPMYNNGERCQVTLLPMRPPSQPLANDAIATFRRLFQADPLTSYPSPPPNLARGISPQGWEYFSIRKLVGGQEGEARTMGATVLLVSVDSQVATIVGTSKDFMVSNCFGLLRGDVWPEFFYSLGFKTAQPSKQAELALSQQLAGTWMTATANVGLGYTFLSNGRYKTTGITRYTAPITNDRALETTQTFFGDGSYSFNGNTMIFTRDDHQRTTHFFRLEQVSKDSGRSWADELCMLDPGSSGEICYRKE